MSSALAGAVYASPEIHSPPRHAGLWGNTSSKENPRAMPSPRGCWVRGMSTFTGDRGMAVGGMAPTVTEKPPTPSWLYEEGVQGIYSTAQRHQAS